MMDHAADVADALLEIGAVKLQPRDRFTWASGLESPIYTDNRVALAYPKVRTFLKEALALRVREFGGVDAVVGVATAGIPHAALVAEHLGLPMAYVRSAAKKHGRQNRIEGRLSPGERVVVIEDLISTGGSSLEAVQALRDAGVEVVATLAIFTYGFDVAAERFAKARVPLRTLSDYPTLIKRAAARGEVNADDLATLSAWREEASAALAVPN